MYANTIEKNSINLRLLHESLNTPSLIFRHYYLSNAQAKTD
jgi:hypothetical protein